MKVWKFRVHNRGPIEMPKGSRIIAVGDTMGDPHVWAEVNPNEEMEERDIYYFGTGWDLPPERTYLGTVHCGGFVWHVYEVADP